MVTSSIAIESQHKVLLVDDDAVSLELMALLLGHEGHQVLRAGDAEAAMELIRADEAGGPDVLLIDLQMPGMSGDQFAAEVRAMKNNGRRPLLIAMSATGAQDQQLLAFDEFLLKPVGLEDLRRALSPRERSRKNGMRVVRSTKPGKLAAAAALDMAVVNKLLAMMPAESLENVVAACIADTRSCVGSLRKMASSGDINSVRATAHRIKGAASMIGASHIARLAGGLEAGVDKQAATQAVLDDLLSATAELEGMLLAGKFKKTRAPHHEPSNHDNTGTT